MNTRNVQTKEKSKESIVQYPVLIAQQGPLEGQRWNVVSDLTIGRDPGCEILISDRQVSRLHAKIYLHNKKVEIEDLGSKNGTFLAGAPLTERAELIDGSVFQVALLQKFVFYLTDATMPLEDLASLPSMKSDVLVLDKKSHRVWIGSREILPPLSVPQFRLLEVLYERPGIVVSRNEMIDLVWGCDQSVGVSDQALDALIRRLRERLAEANSSHPFIITIRGHGLRFENKQE